MELKLLVFAAVISVLITIATALPAYAYYNNYAHNVTAQKLGNEVTGCAIIFTRFLQVPPPRATFGGLPFTYLFTNICGSHYSMSLYIENLIADLVVWFVVALLAISGAHALVYKRNK